MSSSGCTILLDAPADAIRVGFLMSGGADTTALLVPELVSARGRESGQVVTVKRDEMQPQ